MQIKRIRTEFLDGTKKGSTAKMEVKDLGKLVYTKDDKVQFNKKRLRLLLKWKNTFIYTFTNSHIPI